MQYTNYQDHRHTVHIALVQVKNLLQWWFGDSGVIRCNIVTCTV